jgi:hypothetical protein
MSKAHILESSRAAIHGPTRGKVETATLAIRIVSGYNLLAISSILFQAFHL